MSSNVPDWIGETVSTARFAPYLSSASGDAMAAMELYAFNSEVAAAFVHPLHHVEVALRNRLHRRLVDLFGAEAWWDGAPLNSAGRSMLLKARSELRARRRHGHQSDDVVAVLNFGFWVSLLAGGYHRSLWVPALHEVFPGADRGTVHRDYQHVRLLRNRVMHHEPIHQRHLAADHALVCRLLGQLSPEKLAWVRRGDHVPGVLCRAGRASARST